MARNPTRKTPLVIGVATPAAKPPVAPAPKSPKSAANRIANLGDFAHPRAKKKK